MCLFILPLLQALSWWGALSGVMWGVSVMGRIASIQILGLCLASAITDNLLLVTACIYDALFNHAMFLCWPLGATGLGMLGLALTSVAVLHAQAAARHKLLAQVAALTDAAGGPGGQPPTEHPAALAADGDSHTLQAPLLGGADSHTVTLPQPQQQGRAAAPDKAPLVLGLGEAQPWQVVLAGTAAAMLAGIAAGERRPLSGVQLLGIWTAVHHLDGTHASTRCGIYACTHLRAGMHAGPSAAAAAPSGVAGRVCV